MTALTAPRSLILVAVLFCVSGTHAQTTYRWIDKASGRTVYSDQPPPPGIAAITTGKAGTTSDDTQLPYATRQAAEKFPVTLYTSANCLDSCKQARDFLNGRGVPFTEKMLGTQEEFSDLSKRLGGEAALPSITIGPQNFRGYEAGAWNNLLDLAGYPATAPYGVKPSGAFAK